MEEEYWKGFYTCIKCNEKFESINSKEWQQIECPKCSTQNSPEREVKFIFKLLIA